MAKQIPISDTQRQLAIEGFARGDKPSQIAASTGLSVYRIRNLQKKQEIADAVDRMRLTDLIPGQLSALHDTMLAVLSWLNTTDSRLSAVEDEIRKVRVANHRLQVENKNLRETRRDDRKKLREAKAALWESQRLLISEISIDYVVLNRDEKMVTQIMANLIRQTKSAIDVL